MDGKFLGNFPLTESGCNALVAVFSAVVGVPADNLVLDNASWSDRPATELHLPPLLVFFTTNARAGQVALVRSSRSALNAAVVGVPADNLVLDNASWSDRPAT